MRVELLLILGTLVISTNCGWRTAIGQVGAHESSRNRNGSLPMLKIGLIVPHTSFGVREYTRAITRAVSNLHRGHARAKVQTRFTFLDKYRFTQEDVKVSKMKLTPSPTGT